MIEDGVLELRDAWDTDTISENRPGFDEAIRDGDAVTFHSFDWEDVWAAWEPTGITVTAA